MAASDMRARWIVIWVTLALACSPEHKTTSVESPAVAVMSDAVRAELAPGGRLRAALNYSNSLLVKSRAPEHTGVAPDLARELARRAGAIVEFVGYENAGLVADAAREGAWDVAFIGAEPARAGDITFTPAYVEIEATYIVPSGSSIRNVADVDRDGVRIATTSRAAYTLYLQRTLKHAQLVEAEGIPGAADVFAKDHLDALAGLKPRLLEDVKTLPGARILEGRFTAVQQAMGVPKTRPAAAAYLVGFANDIRKSGFLASLIERHQARGLSIAAQ